MTKSGPDTDRPVTVGLVCSHGGHLTEMLELGAAFEGFRTFYFTYEGDTTNRLNNVYLVPNKPYSPIRFVVNLFRLWSIFRRERPDFIVSTGAEIAIPAFLVARMMRVPTLYVECGAQVTRPSLTGRIVIRLADSFYVQWRELVEVYGHRAQYCGSLVDEARPEEAVMLRPGDAA